MTQRRDSRRRSIGGLWYFLVPIATAGMFSAVPYWHAYSRLRTPRLLQWAVVYSVIPIVVIALTSVFGPADDRPEGETSPLGPLPGLLILSALIAALIQLRGIRREVYGEVGAAAEQQRAIVAGAQAARSRREAARSLVSRDPALARELGVGRPDLGRPYDDGGLVDVNSAPAAVLAQVCGVDLATAEAIAKTRDEMGGFYNVGEISLRLTLPPHVRHALDERGFVYA